MLEGTTLICKLLGHNWEVESNYATGDVFYHCKTNGCYHQKDTDGQVYLPDNLWVCESCEEPVIPTLVQSGGLVHLHGDGTADGDVRKIDTESYL